MQATFRRHRIGFVSLFATGVAAFAAGDASAQQQPGPRIQIRQAPTPQAQANAMPAPATPEQALIDAWGQNPDTIGARITAVRKNGKTVLKGRVATKQVYDAAVRAAIDLGIPFTDELVIDTAEARFQARPATVTAVGPTAVAPQWGTPWGPYGAYLYPPPLLGRYDDPFFGMEPPVISYPLDWAAKSARRLAANPPAAANRPAEAIPDGTVLADIDPNGVAVLKGRVPTLADRVAVGQKLMQTEGVSQVVNLLEVTNDQPAGPPQPPADPDQPPPPPRPARADASRIDPPARPGTATPPPAIVPDPPVPGANMVPPPANPLEARVRKSIASVPALEKQPIRIQVRDGVATVAGRMDSAYEAMLAYRAVQKTPGVREIVDLLHFPLPEEDGPNPLVRNGRPEDIEPYLFVQLRNNLGDLANVDKVSVVGDNLTIQGTLASEADRERFFSVLKTMPLLRGFKVNARVSALGD